MIIEEVIAEAYNAFNKRDIDAVLELMAADVHWPNGWEGGYVEGRAAVRDYWTRQWKEINPAVIPLTYKKLDDDNIEVTVHQLVKDYSENLLSDGTVKHVYHFVNGLIQSMEINEV